MYKAYLLRHFNYITTLIPIIIYKRIHKSKTFEIIKKKRDQITQIYYQSIKEFFDLPKNATYSEILKYINLLDIINLGN